MEYMYGSLETNIPCPHWPVALIWSPLWVWVIWAECWY